MLDHILNPLRMHYETPGLAEIQVTEPGAVWHEFPGKAPERIEDPTLTIDYFHQLARALSNTLKIVDFEKSPYLAATLPGGHRLQLCLGGTLKSGIAASIRIWRPRTFGLSDYELTEKQKALIHRAIAEKWNVLISGGMFSGKTSFANACVSLIPTTDRVISVEDTPELDLTHIPNRTEFIVNRLATNEAIDYVEVLKAIMRLRPDRPIVGEQSPDNSWIFGRIINLGHGGTLSTIHADSPELAIDALVQNVEAAGKPAAVAEKIFRSNLHLIIQIARDPASAARRVTDLWVNERIDDA